MDVFEGARERDKLADACCRVAFAAFLHDLGKLAQRGRVFDADPRRDANQQLYCPHHKLHERDAGWFSHLHAADTALALDALERHLPELLGADPSPFAAMAAPDVTDSLINAAAAHHKPETFLQWVVATADRIASGFERDSWEGYNQAKERDDFRTARLLVRFEDYAGPEAKGPRFDKEAAFRFRSPLKPLSADALMPVANGPRDEAEAVAEYRALWEQLAGREAEKSGVGLIPKSHRGQWPLWLDHFDTLWLTVAHAIPSATAFDTRPDVSLYDHSKAVAALAVALWRYHHERGDDPAEVARRLKARADWDDAKFLLVQGDFSGIQAFVFGGAAETQKKAARLLRGRSAMVSLLVELAALALLDELALPPTSQILNAAGKFLIVAPNTEGARAGVERVRTRLDQWFLAQMFGLSGIAVAATGASANDLAADGAFAKVQERLFAELERAKRGMFGLAAAQAPDPVRDADFSQGDCRFDGRLPASTKMDGEAAHPLSADAIALGKALADPRDGRLLVFRADGAPAASGMLALDYFGYRVLPTGDGEATGNFGEFARDGSLRRAFDLSLPGLKADAVPWSGYSRRAVAAFVPLAGHDLGQDPRFDGVEHVEQRHMLTFEHLARADRLVRRDDRVVGVEALGVLKGDIDDLGALFQRMPGKPTFAKTAELSRRVNAFFTLWVPHRLAKDFPTVYTVFAGGDDFFFIGPWRTLRRFAVALRDDFARYVAGNPAIHFSAGYAMAKPGFPVRQLAQAAEEALEAAKARPGKDSFGLFGAVIPWDQWRGVDEMSGKLGQHMGPETEPPERGSLSSGYLYGLLRFSEMKRRLDATRREGERLNPKDALWRSHLFYQTRRFVEGKHGRARDDEARARQERETQDMISAFGESGIGRSGDAFRIALFDQIYARRD
ncbi:MAG: type III-A CRISPR-associated protein Cas10/Csm1 [Sphingomonadaceae bacterium]